MESQIRLIATNVDGVISFGIVANNILSGSSYQLHNGVFFTPIIILRYTYPQNIVNNFEMTSFNIPYLNGYFDNNDEKWQREFVDFTVLMNYVGTTNVENVIDNILGSLQIHILDQGFQPNSSEPTQDDFLYMWITDYININIDVEDMEELNNAMEDVDLFAHEEMDF